MGRKTVASIWLSVMCRLLCSLLLLLAVTGGATPYPPCTCEQYLQRLQVNVLQFGTQGPAEI